jgi:hypothetical protein
MKVYILECVWQEGSQIEGVYSTEPKALKHKEELEKLWPDSGYVITEEELQ